MLMLKTSYSHVTVIAGNSPLTIGLVYRSPNINKEDNRKLQNAIKEVSKGECTIIGDFNHGHIQWNISREYRETGPTVSTFN